MAEKISVQIALQGGAEIERQLADIGEAGQKAFVDISKAADQAGGFKNLKPEEVTKKLQDMGVTGVDALKKIQAAVQSAGRLESIVQGVQKVEAAFVSLGGAALKFGIPVAGAIFLALKQMRSFGQEIIKVNEEAQKLGLSIETFDKLRISLEGAGISAKGISAGLAGVSASINKLALQRVASDFETVKKSWEISGAGTQEIQRLTEAAVKFGPVGKAAAEALQKLGIGIPGTTAKDVEQLGTELAKLKGLTGVGFSVDDTVATRTQKLVEALQQIPDVVERAAIAQQFFAQGSAEFSQAMQTGSLSASNFRASVDANSQAITQSMLDLATKAEQSINRMIAAFARFNVSGVTAELYTLGTIAVEALGNVLTGAWQVVIDKTAEARERIGEFFRSLGEVVWTPITAGVEAWNALTNAIQGAIDSLLKFIGLRPSSGGGGGSGGGAGFAGGGMVGGNGSGTSDSNLAWLSRGEYVVPARAVAQPGVLAFLETLRRGMGHFALGGMVGPAGIPAFAGGGMNAVTINFPGLPEITGLRGSSGVVDELRKAAAMAQVRSGGRKPSRFS